MWSFYHDKSHQIWLWWAIDHAANTPLAFTFGTREHKNLDDLLALLQPFPIRRVYTDNNIAYHKRIPAEQHTTGKRNTQKIERDHLTLRTRIKRLCRKTICFSKNEEIHKAVIGTFINVFLWGRDFDVSTILRHYQKGEIPLDKCSFWNTLSYSSLMKGAISLPGKNTGPVPSTP